MNSYEVLPPAMDRHTLLKCESSESPAPGVERKRAGLWVHQLPHPHLRSGQGQLSLALTSYSSGLSLQQPGPDRKGRGLSCRTSRVEQGPVHCPEATLHLSRACVHNFCSQLGAHQTLCFSRTSLDDPVRFFL